MQRVIIKPRVLPVYGNHGAPTKMENQIGTENGKRNADWDYKEGYIYIAYIQVLARCRISFLSTSFRYTASVEFSNSGLGQYGAGGGGS